MRLILFNLSIYTLLVIIILFNPFGLQTANENHNENLILDITAPNFEVDHQLETIILIDDFSIENIDGISYPLSYPKLAKLLKIISNYKPKMVMIDILQNSEQANTSNSRVWLNQLETSQKSHPIFFADNKLDINSHSEFRIEINKYSTASPVFFTGSSNRYPLKIETNSGYKPSTALLMYQEYCKTKNKYCKEILEADQRFNLPMIVRWNIDQHPKQNQHLDTPENCKNISAYSHSLQFLSKSYSYGAITNLERQELRNKCLPILTLSLYELFQEGSFDSDLLEQAIHEKSVFIGYDLSGVNDKYISPVHGQLPGVFFHAMALMNLYVSGDKYWKAPRPIGNYNISEIDLIQAAMHLLTLIFASIIRDDNIRSTFGGSKKVKRKFILILLMILTLSLPILYSVIYGSLSLINWFAFISIVLFAIGIICQSKIVNKVKESINTKIKE